MWASCDGILGLITSYLDILSYILLSIKSSSIPSLFAIESLQDPFLVEIQTAIKSALSYTAAQLIEPHLIITR